MKWLSTIHTHTHSLKWSSCNANTFPNQILHGKLFEFTFSMPTWLALLECTCVENASSFQFIRQCFRLCFQWGGDGGEVGRSGGSFQIGLINLFPLNNDDNKRIVVGGETSFFWGKAFFIPPLTHSFGSISCLKPVAVRCRMHDHKKVTFKIN